MAKGEGNESREDQANKHHCNRQERGRQAAEDRRFDGTIRTGTAVHGKHFQAFQEALF